MYFKLFSILLIISVYTDAKQISLKRQKIQHKTLEEAIRSGTGDTSEVNIIRPDVNLLLNVSIEEKDIPNQIETALLAIETTSSDMWVISSNCTSAFCKKKPGLKLKGSDELSTAENGLVRGNLSMGMMQLTDNSPEKYFVAAVNFTLADYVDRAVEKRLSPYASGALGIGPNSVLKKSLTPQNIVSLTMSESNGTLYINEIPNFPLNGRKTRIRSMSHTSWKISLGYISTGSPPFKTWCKEGCVAEIDTTFSGISGPAKDINDLNAFLGADEDGSIDCYKKKLINPLVFHIHGQRYYLEAKNFIVKEDKEKDRFSNKCKSQFQVEYSYNGAWRLGLAFLQQFTTAFEYAQGTELDYVSFIQQH